MGKVLRIGLKVFLNKILRRKMPIFLSWSITNRCDFKCRYCKIWQEKSTELSVTQIISFIDKFRHCGTEAISFLGGEPLVREDVGCIIRHCKRQEIYTKITTNGSLIPQRINDIKDVDLVKITLNGPKDIHDFQRREGSYEEVLRAVDLLKANKIKVGLNCVISKANIDYIDEVLEIARQHQTSISFQPLEQRGGFNEYVEHNYPEETKFKKVILTLIEEKKRKNNFIANSLAGLKFLYNWPSPVEVKCWAGVYHFRVLSSGFLMSCDLMDNTLPFYLGPGINIKRGINRMPHFLCEEKCWRNSVMELNFLLSLNPLSLYNLKNVMCCLR